MLNCKNCLHYELCGVFGYINPTVCGFYSERSRVINLPYSLKPGKRVYFVLRDLSELDLREYDVTFGNSAVSDTAGIVSEVGTAGFWVSFDEKGKFDPDVDDFYRWEDFGKDVFPTKKEAEQALKNLPEISAAQGEEV